MCFVQLNQFTISIFKASAFAIAFGLLPTMQMILINQAANAEDATFQQSFKLIPSLKGRDFTLFVICC